MEDNDKIFSYHLRRTLKGLQDEFDRAKSAKRKMDLSEAIDRLLSTDNYRRDRDSWL